MRLLHRYAFFLALILSAHAQAKSVKSPYLENISVTVLAEGDFKAQYEFSGNLGEELVSSSDSGPCKEVTSLFRKVSLNGKICIEAWLKFKCTFEGQESFYKLHRIELDINTSEQNIQLPMLAKNLKNVHLKFQELSLKKGK